MQWTLHKRDAVPFTARSSYLASKLLRSLKLTPIYEPDRPIPGTAPTKHGRHVTGPTRESRGTYHANRDSGP